VAGICECGNEPSGHFTPIKTHVTLYTEGCVGSRDSLDVWGIYCPYRDSINLLSSPIASH